MNTWLAKMVFLPGTELMTIACESIITTMDVRNVSGTSGGASCMVIQTQVLGDTRNTWTLQNGQSLDCGESTYLYI